MAKMLNAGSIEDRRGYEYRNGDDYSFVQVQDICTGGVAQRICRLQIARVIGRSYHSERAWFAGDSEHSRLQTDYRRPDNYLGRWSGDELNNGVKPVRGILLKEFPSLKKGVVINLKIGEIYETSEGCR